MLTVVVFGGRTYGVAPLRASLQERALASRQKAALWLVLGAIHFDVGIRKLVHGGANGADSLGGLFARETGLEEVVFRADWDRLGKAAGPERNGRMAVFVAAQLPDALGVMCEGGAGTRDMASLCEAYRIPLKRVVL